MKRRNIRHGLLALPALLMLFDPLTAKLTHKAGFLDTAKKEAETK